MFNTGRGNLAWTVAVAALLSLGAGCRELESFSTQGGEIYKGDIVGGKRELSAAAPAADRPRRDRPSGTRPRRSGSSGTTATSTEAGRAATGDVVASDATSGDAPTEATES